jgi:serine/threonine protein kinase/tetratricopeptide (TPR) repeat protein
MKPEPLILGWKSSFGGDGCSPLSVELSSLTGPARVHQECTTQDHLTSPGPSATIAALIGRRLSHYQITAKIGSGGMGEVYRAEDTRLERDVAFKVLPEEMAADRTRISRFQREAKTVAALNHPNIVTLHSVEEADGVHFLTMELVAGKAIDELLPAGGFALDRFFALAIPIADAVASAHSCGVIHRDLKPANVMVTDEGGRVKVLDFGLAKLTADDRFGGASHLKTMTRTQDGLILGTQNYMSPEQARGESVDHRSDIFSLGVLFFEMLTGDRPFKGTSAVAVLAAILKDQPAPLSRLRPDLPRHLGRVIGRCLEKAPGDRYQAASDVYNELRTLQRETVSSREQRPEAPGEAPPNNVGSVGSEAPAEAPRIAVLPLRVHSSDPELDALADGLTDGITIGLSRFPHLYVVSAGSKSASSQETADVRQLGRKLGASFAVEGSLRQAGSSIRVGVRLVDTATGTHLWAEHFDQDLAGGSLFDLQDQLVDRIVATVADTHGVLVRSIASLVKTKPVEELTAYECVIRVLDYQQRLSSDEHAELRSALEGALDRDPNNTRERALAAAQRAIEIDPTSQSGHFALAHTSFTRKDYSACRAAGERLLELNPRDTFAMAVVGLLTACSDDWDRGTSLIRQAMALNPHHSGFLNVVLAWDSYRQGEYGQALQGAEKRSMPGFYKWQCIMAAATAQLGRYDAAREHVDRLLALIPDFETVARQDLSKEFASESFIEHFLEGLQKAGLEIKG